MIIPVYILGLHLILIILVEMEWNCFVTKQYDQIDHTSLESDGAQTVVPGPKKKSYQWLIYWLASFSTFPHSPSTTIHQFGNRCIIGQNTIWIPAKKKLLNLTPIKDSKLCMWTWNYSSKSVHNNKLTVLSFQNVENGSRVTVEYSLSTLTVILCFPVKNKHRT